MTIPLYFTDYKLDTFTFTFLSSFHRVESLTINQMGKKPADFRLNPKIGDYQLAQDSLIPMGITSENVAERYNVSREKQDKMAMISHQKAARAQKEVIGVWVEKRSYICIV